MITIVDCFSDRSNYPAFIGGMLAGLFGMVKWVFPFLNAFTGLAGALYTLTLTGGSTFVVLIVTGLYKKNENRILTYVEKKIPFINRKEKRDAKKKNTGKAA